MEWSKGMETLRNMKGLTLQTQLVSGDVIQAMMAEQGVAYKQMAKEQQVKNRDWKAKGYADLCYQLKCSKRHIEQLIRVAETYPVELVARDPKEPNQFEETWSYLYHGTRYDHPWEAVQWALDHELSFAEFKQVEEVDGEFKVVPKDTQEATSGGTVECPKCGEVFPVKPHKKHKERPEQ